MGKSHRVKAVGSRAEVWHGNANHTSGGLKKGDLMKNKSGRIVSRRKHNTAKREKRLVKHGYGTKKGKFGYVMLNGKSARRSRGRKGRRSMRGGHNNINSGLSPSAAEWDGIDGQGLYEGSTLSGPETDAVNASGGGRRRRSKHKLCFNNVSRSGRKLTFNNISTAKRGNKQELHFKNVSMKGGLSGAPLSNSYNPAPLTTAQQSMMDTGGLGMGSTNDLNLELTSVGGRRRRRRRTRSTRRRKSHRRRH